MTGQGPQQPPSSGDPWSPPQQPAWMPGERSEPSGGPEYGSPPPPGEPAGAAPYGSTAPPVPGEPSGAPQYGSPPPPPGAPIGAGGQWGPTEPAVVTGTPGRGLAIASLILGIVAVIFVLLLAEVSIVAGIAGLALGFVARSRARSGMSLAGIILSAVGIVLGVILIIVGLAIRHMI